MPSAVATIRPVGCHAIVAGAVPNTRLDKVEKKKLYALNERETLADAPGRAPQRRGH